MKAKSDIWMYNSQGERLFKEGENIPNGYVDTPAKVKKPSPKLKVVKNDNK